MNALKTTFFLALLSALMILIGYGFAGERGMLMALVLAAGMNFFSYWFSDRLVLAMHRAQPITREQSPRLYEILERLTGQAGLPMPRIYLLPEEAPNAFATGRDPRHAAVAVTAGIMRLLNEEELEGVLAHELSHVRNRDILISSVAATLASAIMVLASMARWAALFGFGGRSDRDGPNPLVLIVSALVAPIAAMLIQLAVSRAREYQADQSGAAMTRNPYGLASALQKLETYSRRIPMRTAGASSNHLFIVKPFSGQAMANLFSTHPPIRERIRRLTGR
ncbi:MAG TPA: zinc metalloprotease HtpX [Candidatus Polarisedimenticolia bacterium]|nr:zinc metalloprotease HtpX [Candidatus Polarisedimenticolia bacterium]